MRRKRRIEISVETREVSMVSLPGRTVRSRCATCAQRVDVATIDEATALTRIDSRTIYQLVEAGRVHFMETPEGFLLICLNSLSAFLVSNRQSIAKESSHTIVQSAKGE